MLFSVIVQICDSLKEEIIVQVKVFWVVTPCSAAVGYQCFWGPCCYHKQYMASQPRIPQLENFHDRSLSLILLTSASDFNS